MGIIHPFSIFKLLLKYLMIKNDEVSTKTDVLCYPWLASVTEVVIPRKTHPLKTIR